jgi:SAM-dependent methyltransferase
LLVGVFRPRSMFSCARGKYNADATRGALRFILSRPFHADPARIRSFYAGMLLLTENRRSPLRDKKSMRHQQIDYFGPQSLTNRFRSRRFKLFKTVVEEVLSEKSVCRILDLGGTPGYWETFGLNLDWSRLHVTILNLQAPEITRPGIITLSGDARDLREFEDLSFDIVHSNSVIEHVGRWDDMASMAKEVRRLAERYFVQTPYFWFPIEPHARFPFLHWMPESWRYRILMRRTCGYWQRRPDVGAATKAVQSAVLLDKLQVQFLFPEARIIRERFLGLTKSLIAVRSRIVP